MTKIGQYQIVDVVCMTPTGAVSTVRMPRRSGVVFALKQLKSVHTDPDEPQWDSQLFLDRARVQKSVVAAGGKYWLPIRDMGTAKEGAWVVMDYYPLSAQKLIESHAQLGPGELHHVVQSVVKGLVELQQAGIGRDTLRDDDMRSCMMTVVRSWTFPPLDAPNGATLNYPFIFSTSGYPGSK